MQNKYDCLVTFWTWTFFWGHFMYDLNSALKKLQLLFLLLKRKGSKLKVLMKVFLFFQMNGKTVFSMETKLECLQNMQ